MIQEYQLRVLPEVAANEQQLKEYLVQEKGLNVRNINATRILKRCPATNHLRQSECTGISERNAQRR